MSANTKIGWTKSTFNPWIGCTKVSPACDHCYAEAWAKRMGRDFAQRARTSEANWKLPLAWNRKAMHAPSERWLVFCASLADVFDNQVPDQWREDLWEIIRATPLLTWQLTTKRIGNAKYMLPQDWGDKGYPNVWLISTVSNQAEADRDIPKLIEIPARVHGLSVEPMLERIDLFRWHHSLQWIILGGESGSQHRPMDMEAARALVTLAINANVPVFIKQDSSYRPGARGRWSKEEWAIKQFPPDDGLDLRRLIADANTTEKRIMKGGITAEELQRDLLDAAEEDGYDGP